MHLAAAGVPVYDSDSRTKAIYSIHPEIVGELQDALGERITDGEGKLDRRLLAAVIFGDSEKLGILESIVHPRVYDDFVEWRDSQPQGTAFVVLESAIFPQKPLFHPLADAVMLVKAPDGERMRRVMLRDNATGADVKHRMDNQEDVDGFRADAVIENDSDLETLYARVDEAILKLKDKLFLQK